MLQEGNSCDHEGNGPDIWYVEAIEIIQKRVNKYLNQRRMRYWIGKEAQRKKKRTWQLIIWMPRKVGV